MRSFGRLNCSRWLGQKIKLGALFQPLWRNDLLLLGVDRLVGVANSAVTDLHCLADLFWRTRMSHHMTSHVDTRCSYGKGRTSQKDADSGRLACNIFGGPAGTMVQIQCSTESGA